MTNFLLFVFANAWRHIWLKHNQLVLTEQRHDEHDRESQQHGEPLSQPDLPVALEYLEEDDVEQRAGREALQYHRGHVGPGAVVLAEGYAEPDAQRADHGEREDVEDAEDLRGSERIGENCGANLTGERSRTAKRRDTVLFYMGWSNI